MNDFVARASKNGNVETILSPEKVIKEHCHRVFTQEVQPYQWTPLDKYPYQKCEEYATEDSLKFRWRPRKSLFEHHRVKTPDRRASHRFSPLWLLSLEPTKEFYSEYWPSSRLFFEIDSIICIRNYVNVLLSGVREWWVTQCIQNTSSNDSHLWKIDCF